MTGGRLFSASEEEIRRGYTTDVYFGRTKRILEARGNGGTEVWAEVTGSSLPRDWDWAVYCGLEEVLRLAEGYPIDMYSVPEGTVFRVSSSNRLLSWACCASHPVSPHAPPGTRWRQAGNR